MPIVHNSFEDPVITGIVCLTIIILTLIIKGLLLKIHKQKDAGIINDVGPSSQEDAINLQTRNDLIVKLLNFEETLAKNGSKHSDEEDRYRDTIIRLMKEFCNLGDILDNTTQPEKPKTE